jgi:hypothetical protein
MATPTSTELAVELWGESEGFSRSPGARKVRKIARELFSDDAPGKGGEWDFTEAQTSTLRERLSFASPSARPT